MLETTLKNVIVNFLIFSYKKCFKNYIDIDIKYGKSLNYIEIELIKIL